MFFKSILLISLLGIPGCQITQADPLIYSDSEALIKKLTLEKIEKSASKRRIYQILDLNPNFLEEDIGHIQGWVIQHTWVLSPSYRLYELEGGTFEDGSKIRIEKVDH